MNVKPTYFVLSWMDNLCQHVFDSDYQTVEAAEMVERAEKPKETSHLLNNIDRTRAEDKRISSKIRFFATAF